MSRKPYSLSKQLVVATALALGTSGVALADDSSMSRFGGDSYAYFNQPVSRNAAASPAWRQSHQNGLTDHELQALSSSGLAASAPEFNPPMFASVPADPSWRRSHPNGLTEPELQALSASGLSASAPEFNPPMFASAPADPSWRQSHPNGLTARELQGLSSSNLAVWQAPNGSENTATASIDWPNGAWTPSKETFAARLAKFFQPNGAPAGTQ